MNKLAQSAVLLLCIAIPAMNSAASESMEKVTVEQGTLIGKEIDGTAIFKGVPFAKAPTGERRWKAPVALEKWKGKKEAFEYAPACMQAGDPPSGKSEDCLYLNIWSPAKTHDDKVPVFVWIYGGGFSFGASSDPIFDGKALAKDGVIVVSIAYRVGQLGFLAHPQLSEESPSNTSGNYGLLDQIAALKWIKKNIHHFGGDSSNITIAGESAGGIAVSMLAASPLAKGLFDKAISQSGGSFGPVSKHNAPGENMSSLATAEKEGVGYVKQFNATSVKDLRKLPAENFVPEGWSMAGGWPIVDGYVIPDDQYRLYEQGKFNDTPILVGYNSDEGVSFVRDNDPEAFNRGLRQRFDKYASKIMQAYSVPDDEVSRHSRNVIRDAAFGWHTWSWAKLQASHGNGNAYLYYFDQHPTYPKDSPKYNQGSPHGQDIAYVFKHLDQNNPEITETDVELSNSISRYWTNFAKHGNPNGKTLPEWPAFNADSQQVMHFHQTPKTGTLPDKAGLQALDDYFKWRRTSNIKD